MNVTDDMLEKLNEGQKHCLRLVLSHLNSKEIGRELDISPHTVDQRLREAMRITGTNSRFEAARKFARLESEHEYQPLIYQQSSLEVKTRPATIALAVKEAEQARQTEFERSLLPDQISMTSDGAAVLIQTNEDQKIWPLPRYRGDRNDMSTLTRMGWIVAIAIGSALSFGGVLAGLESLASLRS
jgi:DNA-binding CsgD family transcriptional regulator